MGDGTTHYAALSRHLLPPTSFRCKWTLVFFSGTSPSVTYLIYVTGAGGFPLVNKATFQKRYRHPKIDTAGDLKRLRIKNKQEWLVCSVPVTVLLGCVCI